MNPLTLCLSIAPLNGTVRAPQPVSEIVHNHVIQEMRRESPNLRVSFRDPACPNVIHYEEGISSITITGSTTVWNGQKQISYTDALAQRPISFEENLLTPSPAETSTIDNSGASSSWKRWAFWTGVGLVTAGVGYHIYHSRRDNDHPASKRAAATPAAAPAPTPLNRGVTF